jgi:hypothetical protein
MNYRSIFSRLLPLLLATIYLFVLHDLHSLRGDHYFITGVILTLWYSGKRFREVFHFILPLILVFVVYDSMRFYADFLRGPIHVKEPYLFDKTFFGIKDSLGHVLTPNEWWQKHTHWFLDLYTGSFYLLFIAIYVLVSAYFCFWLPRTGTKLRTREWIQSQQHSPMWAFFFVNLLGYSTYYWFAAAPPWYVASYGLGPANLSAHASAAGCLRFDAILGTHFFTGMYGRATDVFGAVPSLHVAYPLQAVYYSFRYGALRAFSVIFYLSMCFSAVYLNHHYVLDILWGSAYALIVATGLEAFRRFLSSKTQNV